MDALIGTKAINSSEVITPSKGGQYTYTISCDGAGGTSKQSVSLIVPMQLYTTSTENAKLTNLSPMLLPLLRGKYYQVTLANASAFADLEQKGAYNYIAMPLDSSESDPYHQANVYIFRGTDGNWTDVTSQLVTGSTVGCEHARKAIVADFNADDIPDVFFACHGTEVQTVPQGKGEDQYILLSQPGGRFALNRLKLSTKIYGHGATALDVDGDGKIDIVLTDTLQNSLGKSPVWVLRGNGDGTFREDHQPQLTAFSGRGVYSVESFTVSGKRLLWIAGADDAVANGGKSNAFWSFDSAGNIASTPAIKLPDMTESVPGCITCLALPLDVLVVNNIAYVLRVQLDYRNYAIQRVDLNSGVGSIPFSYSGVSFDKLGSACSGIGGSWIDFIHATDGKIVTFDKCRSPNLLIN
jgi:hypothetical protein